MNDNGNITGKTLIAIDLGSSLIRMMAAVITQDDRLKVLGIETEACPDGSMRYGTVINSSEVAMHITRCHKALVNLVKSRHNIDVDGSPVFVSLGSRHSQVVHIAQRQELKNRRVSQNTFDELRAKCRDKFLKEHQGAHVYNITCYRVVLNKSAQYMSYAETLDKTATHIEADYFLVIDKSDKHDYIDRNTMRQTGKIQPKQYFSKAEALSSALLTDKDKLDGSVIIDFGAQTTTLYIYKDNQLRRLDTVRLGGDTISNDLATSCYLTRDMAERLKTVYVDISSGAPRKKYRIINCNDGQPMYVESPVLQGMVTMRLEEIMEPLFGLISEHADFAGAKIYLCGGASQLEGLEEYVRDHTGMDVKFGSHDAWLTDDTPEEYCDPTYSMLVGTLACGMEHLKNQQEQEQDKKDTGKDKKKGGIWKKILDFAEKEMDDLFSDYEDNENTTDKKSPKA